MKAKIILLITMMVAAFSAYAAEKATTVFTLDHQMSTHCEKKIIDNLRFEKGVSDIKVSLKDNTITITYNPSKTNPETLIGAFKKIGFTAFVVNPECPEAQVAPCCAPVPEACCEPTPQPCCTDSVAAPCCVPVPEACCE